jgi:ATP-dependent DNA ligase
VLAFIELRYLSGRNGVRSILNTHYQCDGATIYTHACKLGCEGIVSKRLGSLYRSGRVADWLKVKNPAAPGVKREAEEDWGGRRRGPASDKVRP